MTDSIEKKCIANGVKLTDQRRTIARVISESKKTYGEADVTVSTSRLIVEPVTEGRGLTGAFST